MPSITKKIIAFDLETIADPAMMALLPEVKPAKNLKDPVKIEADLHSKKQAQISNMGLSPMLNMICSAGWADSDGKTGTFDLAEATAGAEKNLLIQMWDHFNHYDHFVSFNGRGFDLPCIRLHGIGHGIKPAVNIDSGRYNRTGSNHTDIRLILAGDDKFAPGKLDFFAQKFLKEQKTEGIDGGLVQGYWDMGLIDEISQYCIQDCLLTLRLFEKIEVAGLLE